MEIVNHFIISRDGMLSNMQSPQNLASIKISLNLVQCMYLS